MAPKSWNTQLDLQRSPNVLIKMTNMTIGDLCRSSGGSYDFGAMETFDQHANMYQNAEFHKNRTYTVSFSYPDNGTFGDLCRSSGGSYDFGAIETIDQHAKIYQHADFHQNRTYGTFPVGNLLC